jgi:16S rRNA (guanine966-N2)-methyltransferase
LDLFSGSGCIGLEALSRGATYVVFNDRDAAMIHRIEKILKRFGTERQRYALYTGDWQNTLVRLTGQRFDFIYLDPPYQDALYTQLLQALPLCLKQGGILAVEHPADMPLIAETPLRQTDVRCYGSVAVSLYSKEEAL